MARPTSDRFPLREPGMAPGGDAGVDARAAYRALVARDARFDGRFFVGVTTTGIYCRPICRVRTPLERNCTFHASAAAAEAAGFRPCLKCRPELAPGFAMSEASATLAVAAARLIDAAVAGACPALGTTRALMPAIAARLGVGERQLRRLFETRFGVAPVAYAQTQRLLLARRFLTDTDWPVATVAFASGFASVRRMNALFAARYGFAPTRLRRHARRSRHGAGDGVVATGPRATFMVAYRPPYDFARLVDFFSQRAIDGVETVTPGPRGVYRRVLRLPSRPGGILGVIEVCDDPTRAALRVTLDAALAPHAAAVLALVRRVFDTEADPHAIAHALGTLAAGAPGLRLPGAFDPFELAVRAVLGQQVTVKAARTLASRFVAAFGDPHAPGAGLTHAFPTPARIAATAPETIAALGIVGARSRAIVALAQAFQRGSIDLAPGASLDRALATLTTLPGVGPWTAHYIAMRALSWPDAWPPRDVALMKALGLSTDAAGQRAADARADAWRPWRSYAVLHLWRRLEAATPPIIPTPRPDA
jgi:AraC family transcriptional regulator of adaptative response / DNA-3-methyladenine glycosylase II